MRLYGIFDLAASMYVDRVLVLPADASAKRLFQEACTDARSELAKYPRDYELWFLGELDPGSGVITSERSLVMSGLEAVGGQLTLDPPQVANG